MHPEVVKFGSTLSNNLKYVETLFLFQLLSLFLLIDTNLTVLQLIGDLNAGGFIAEGDNGMEEGKNGMLNSFLFNLYF